MRIIILFVALSLSAEATPQGNPAFALARSLSENHQFQASNEALSDFIAKYPTRLYDLSTAFFLQSYNYMQLGAYYQAMVANRESLALKEQLALEGVGENFMRSGAIYLLAGDLYRAEEQLLAAKEYPIESAEVYALIDGYLGAVYMEQGELERAAAYFRQSVESLQIDFGDDHPDLVTAHYHLGLLALEQRQYEEAEVELRKALGIAVKLRQHRTMGQIYNALAKVYERTAPDQAYSTYDKAISLLTRQFGRHHVEVARTHMNLSRYYLLEEEEEKAKGQLGEALRSLLPEEQVNGWQFQPAALPVTLDPVLLIEVLGQRAAMLMAQEGDISTARLELALASTELAADLLAGQLAAVGGEATRLLINRRLYGIFGPGLKAAAQLAAQQAEQQYRRRAFQLAEKGRAMLSRAAQQSSDLMLEKANLEIGLKEALRTAQAHYAQHPDQADALLQLQEARRAFRVYRQTAPEGTSLSVSPLADISTIQARMAPDELLLSYFVTAEEYFIFALDQQQLSMTALPLNYGPRQSEQGLQALLRQGKQGSGTGVGIYSKLDPKVNLPSLSRSVEGFRRAIKKLDGPAFGFYGADLYGKLIYPIRDRLAQKKQLTIIPHEDLFSIPFEALLSQAPKGKKVKYHKYKYLIRDYAVRYRMSAGPLIERSSADTSFELDFAGFAPVFSQGSHHSALTAATFAEDSLQGAQVVMRQLLANDGPQFRAIPQSAEEVTAIAELLKKKGRTQQTLLRQEASETALKELAARTRWLHLATHSFSQANDPERSGVALAPPTAMKEDGILFLSEIRALNIPAELVVLSSCQGNLGPLLKGEGVASLARAFALAGSERTLSALWSVYDTQTNALMRSFYANLLKEVNYTVALRAAKLELLKQKRMTPRSWSAFLLYSLN